MGLIKAALGAAGGVLADQWKEYFYCEALPENVLLTKGKKRVSSRSSNTKGSDNIISNGSIIAVADGQCMLIVEQGKVVDICAEPGEFVYDLSTEPSIFYGKLSQTIPAVLKEIGKRFTFGGEAPKDQRVYYVNTKELMGNKYGTPSPVPFRVVDANIRLDVDISIKCFGEYSYHITNPVLFYTNVCGNVSDEYTRDRIDSQLKSELLTALQPAFAKISEMGIRYSALPGHTLEMADALNEVLSKKWGDLRGIEIASFGINAQAQAMQDAAKNTAGAPMAFMGMGMAQNAGGINASTLFQMGQQQAPAAPAAPAAAPAAGWTCPKCGSTGNTGKFCAECGEKQPAAEGWTCPKCGAVNKGKFCAECGDPFDSGDIKG